MPNLIASKTVKARKPHRCMCCNAIAIRPGETYQRDTLVYDGRVYNWVACRECDSLTNTVWAWAYHPDEGVSGDDYTDWADEHRDDPEHGQAARAFLARLRGESL